jgi:tyrosine-protein kinase Etk/Wzc
LFESRLKEFIKYFEVMKKSEDILANNLLRLIKDLMKYWYLIAISLALALSISLLYLKYSAKTYRVSGSILLRLEETNRFAGRGNNDILPAFQLIQQDKTMQNEIYFMQSLPLIREIVGEMDIRTYYYIQENNIPKKWTFSYKNMYRDTPFWVIPAEDNVQPAEIFFNVRIIDEEVFHISASSDEAVIMNFSRGERVISNAKFNIEGVYNFGAPVENDLASFTILLNSNYDPDRHSDKNFFFKFNNLNWLAGSFKSSLSIDSKSMESSLAELTVRAENQVLGLDFLNALIDKYIERNMEESNFLANKTIEHIEQQLLDVSDDLALSEQQLQNLRRDHSVMNMEEKAQNIYQQLANSRTRREEAQRRLSHLEQLEAYFTEYKDSTRILAPSALGLNDQMLNNLIQELVTMNSEKQRIISQDQIRNPRLVTIDITIENLKNQISENIDFTIRTTRREIGELDAQIRTLNQEFASLPETQRQLLGIERRFNLNDAIYTSLLERRIQAQIIKASKLPDAKVIEPPRATGIASPNRMIVLFFAVFIGLLLPSSGILGMKLIADRITSKDDARLITRIPILGAIPVNESSYQNVVRELPRSPMSEAFHILRTNLVYSLKGENNKTILVTSSVPGEGKSFTAINLATSFAQANSKTILIEFDLRNPNKFVNEAFNTNELVGISSYLINKATLEEIIVPTEVSNLDIILAGQIPPNPVELISTPKTSQLFQELKKRYDFIIIDTPPYSLVTDAFLLMNVADIKLYISRLGYTKKKDLAMNMEEIEEKNIRDIHLVMNGSHELNTKYGKYAYTEKTGSQGSLLNKKMEQLRKKTAAF